VTRRNPPPSRGASRIKPSEAFIYMMCDLRCYHGQTMASASFANWAAARADRIKRLRAAHEAFGGTGPGRRWVTDELNHALILRLASEFQGFVRDLHDETGLFIARSLAPGNQQLQDSLRIPYTLHRKMNQGNADPGTLGNDFGLFGMVLWGPCTRDTPRTLRGGTISWRLLTRPATASRTTTARRSRESSPTAGR
jgi:hypothetical protein